MKYDTVVFDLDGVLLEEGKLTSEGKIGIEMLFEKGVRVIYSSGKNYWYTAGGISFSNIIKDDTIIIAENGGIIFFPLTKEKLVLSQGYGNIAKLAEYFYKEHCTKDGNHTVFKDTGGIIWQEPKETIFTLFPKDKNTIPILKKVLEDIIIHLNFPVYAIDHSDAVDIMPLKQHKGNALKYLSNKGIINMEKTVAFGDGNNDKEMLEEVGMPVTVDNASDAIKHIVRSREGIITSKGYGKGVLEAIEHLF